MLARCCENGQVFYECNKNQICFRLSFPLISKLYLLAEFKRRHRADRLANYKSKVLVCIRDSHEYTLLRRQPEHSPAVYIKDESAAVFLHSDGWHKGYSRIQILTVEKLLSGKQVDMQPSGITSSRWIKLTPKGMLEF